MRAAGMAIVLAALVPALLACGGGSEPAATTAPPQRAAHAAGHPWLYVWRNFELTGVPEELTIHRDGTLRYRNLLHTQRGIPVRDDRLTARQVAALGRLLSKVDLRDADASAVTPRRSGYRWVIRARGLTGTAADGHLHGAMRALVDRLRPLMDRLQTG